MKRGEVWWVNFDPSVDGKESKAMVDQLATVSKLRLFKRAGLISEEGMLKINEVIKIQLDIY